LSSIKGLNNIVYLDESGFNGKENFRHKCWAERGMKVHDKITGSRFKRESLLLAQSGDYKNFYAPYIFDGTCNTDFFNSWLEQILLPELPPNQVIIMDNARIHKSAKTKELIEEAGHILLYLPPYSPDFNPIEKTFGLIKRWFRSSTKETTLSDIILSHL